MTEKKTKLVQVTHDLALGGLQRVIVNICRTIDREKFDISVLCLRELGCFTDEVKALGIPVTLIPQKNGTDYLSFLKVADYFRSVKPDVIHTHNTQPFMDGTIAALLTGVKRIIHTDHARSFPDKWRYMAIEWLMSQFAYKVVGVSEHTSQNLMKYEKISPKKIVTIPNGIDPVPFDITIDKIKKRKELGLPDDGPILGVAVRLSEQKGLTYLIKAMPEIIKKFPTVSLLIAGDGPLKDTLIEETKHLGVQNNVYFLGMRHDTAELLKLFDLYVLPSIWEGLPMIILEAMAAGCPIIATDVGGVGAAVRDGVNGILIHPEEIHTLGQKVVQLLDDERTCGKFAFNTRTIFDEEFSAENMTKMYQQFYLN
jgi:glycosyltransferase involved in cell wall biosynthesis